jgi:outer membrane protein assembly factor BamB
MGNSRAARIKICLWAANALQAVGLASLVAAETMFAVPHLSLPPLAGISSMSDFASPPPKPAKDVVSSKPFRLRLWPAVLILAVMLAMVNGPKLIETDSMIVMMICLMLGPILGLLGMTIWWLFFSRVSWTEGFGVLLFGAICGGVLYAFAHPSMGMSLFLAALPMVLTVSVAWLIVSFFLVWPVRRIGLLIAIGFTCFYYSLLKFEGVDGGFNADISWRWDKTAEEKYVASLVKASAVKKETAPEAVLAAVEGDWVGFRGAGGDSVYSGDPISEDWATSPPKLLWKRSIGPGWSSFAVIGKYVFTQEQRDKSEVVTAHDAETGDPIWDFSYDARFEEYIAGPGPRSTPLFYEGRLYVVGAKGSVHCLDPSTGKKIWRAEMVNTEVKAPEWGFSCSPVAVGDVIVTIPGKPDNHAVVAFDKNTGKKRWSTAKGEHSYTSAHLATICGVPQVLAFTSAGLMGIEPQSGKILWNYEWDLKQVARCVQPYVEGDTVVISTYMDNDMRKLKFSKDGDKWNSEELWKSKDLKPYYNDMVVLDGIGYGFDVKFFSCIDLETGKRKWKGNRKAGDYGNGQVLLLKKQKKLLVLTEKGEVALLEANPEKIVELAKFNAIEGKTWNHPVVAHGKLYVRNGEEMACFDVQPKEGAIKAVEENAE